MEAIKGRLHSFQSLGAVDGPGVRYVIFTQGCPYTCPYCHNPDTKSFSGGSEYTAEEIAKKVLRYKSYFGSDGGVTVSGGEPLMQCEFVAELFKLLHAEGVNTALDTAAAKPTDAIKKLLTYTDTVLCDIKHPSAEICKEIFGVSLENTLEFLKLCDETGKNVIIRHVVVPGFTDTKENILALKALADKFKSVSAIELLPFHKMCEEKYKKLGLPFPLACTPECEKETIEKLKKYL